MPLYISQRRVPCGVFLDTLTNTLVFQIPRRMHQRRLSSGLSCFFSCLLLIFFSGSVGAYKNYTVGDSLGWFDKLEKSGVNYQKWATGKDFSLGDFLIFNTDTNHSVILTYNSTTYKLCDYAGAQDGDTTQYSAGDPSATDPRPVMVAVPLLKEGMVYFFSGDYDGEQCQNGQHFNINVTHGKGLPSSLRSASTDSAPSPVSPQSGDDDDEDSPVPDTVVPANFNNPKGLPPKPKNQDDQDDKTDISSVAVSVSTYVTQKTLSGVLIIFWLLVPFH